MGELHKVYYAPVSLVIHSAIYNCSDRNKRLAHFYKHPFDLEKYDVTLWIVGRNFVLDDAVFSITGNCR